MNAESFAYAGTNGFSVMAIPMAGPTMRPILEAYRQAWRDAGHPGNGEVMLAFQMFVDRDGERARRIAKPRIDSYLAAIVGASSDWATGTTSKDYAGYDKMVAKLKAETFETQLESGSAWVGSPAEVRATIAKVQEEYGGFEHASMQVNFYDLGFEDAMGSLELFSQEVIGHVTV
jgi:alkanesulfonate monooxygenase SsuD/methylene tetrahydromethanopterin reductase-like flavin-dependent oxidoreductase (luciferase family)